MQARIVPIESLHVPDYCRREHTKDQIGRFTRHFKDNGQYQPIVVAGDEVLCGVLVWLGMKEAGATECLVNDLGADLPLERRKEIRYLDNRIYDIEDWDAEALADFLMGLDEAHLDDCGFTAKEASAIVNGDDVDLSPMPAVGLKDLWECDKCGWEGELPKKRPKP